MMEAARTSETSVDNYFTRQYIPEDNSEIKCYYLQRNEFIPANLLTAFNAVSGAGE
jgi:hypothetical protein